MRRILYISPFDAEDLSCGAAQRSHFLYEALRRSGEVTFVRAAELERRGSLKRVVRRLVSALLPGMLLPLEKPELGRFDVVVTRYVRYASYYSAWRFGPLYVDVDDLPTDVCPKCLKFAYRRWMTWVLRHAACAWVSNPADGRRLLAECGGLGIRVLPLENIAFPPGPGYRFDAPRQNRVITIAHLGYQPNYQGIDRFLKTRWPQLRAETPDLRYRIIGKGLPKRFDARWRKVPGVELTGFVDDIEKEYEECKAVVCPVDTGGGTSIKVLEALAHRRELIASDFAMRGVGGHCGTFEDFARQVEAALDRARRIPVVFSVDDRYLLPLEIAVRSLLESKKPDTDYDVVVLTGEMSLAARNRIQKRFPCLRFVEVPVSTFADAPVGWLSPATYNRLLLADALPEYDRVIWSDADVLFKGDLTDIYRSDFGEFDWAGVAMERHGETKGLHNHFPENHNDFLHAPGFMVVNAREWRENRMVQRFKDVICRYGSRLTMQDFDVLNLACRKIAAISFRYCVFESIREGESLSSAKEYPFLSGVYSQAELMAAKTCPLIIHYCGINPKVWRRSVLEIPQEYRSYWKSSPFRQGWFRRRADDLKYLTRSLRGVARSPGLT